MPRTAGRGGLGFGAKSWDRTSDARAFNAALYRLSYRGDDECSQALGQRGEGSSWRSGKDSNLRCPGSEPGALDRTWRPPNRKQVAREAGFEPANAGIKTQCLGPLDDSPIEMCTGVRLPSSPCQTSFPALYAKGQSRVTPVRLSPLRRPQRDQGASSAGTDLVCGRGGRTRTFECLNQNQVPWPTWRLPYRNCTCTICRATVTRPWGTLASSPTQHSEDLQDFYLLELSHSFQRAAFYGSARSCCCAAGEAVALNGCRCCKGRGSPTTSRLQL